MDWLIDVTDIHNVMEDIVAYSLYGLGSVDSLLNLRTKEFFVLKQTMKNEDIKDIFKKIKLHKFD